MLKRFLSYVEIRTKLASVLPFMLGLLYARLAYGQTRLINSLLFFLSMICLDMATTALNNLMDDRVNIGSLPVTKRAAKVILAVLLLLAAAAGLLLALRTSLVVLACGALCFLAGILYTAGPAPIAHMPLGEAFSGVFMGFFIPFLTVLVNAPQDSLIGIVLNASRLQLTFDLSGLLKLFILTIPAVCSIAGVMLANNICDLDYDVSIKRHTLPYHIGVPRALDLYAALYGLAAAAVIAMAVLGVLPFYVLAALPAYFPVRRNVQSLRQRQDKRETFPLSVQNLLLVLVPLIIIALVAVLT